MQNFELGARTAKARSDKGGATRLSLINTPGTSTEPGKIEMQGIKEVVGINLGISVLPNVQLSEPGRILATWLQRRRAKSL